MLIDGNAVREYREKTGITIDEMADMLNLEGEQLVQFENGQQWRENDDFRLLILNSILEGLDYVIPVSLDSLYEEYL